MRRLSHEVLAANCRQLGTPAFTDGILTSLTMPAQAFLACSSIRAADVGNHTSQTALLDICDIQQKKNVLWKQVQLTLLQGETVILTLTVTLY